MTNKRVFLCLAAVFASFTVACKTGIDINKVSSAALDKALFDGEWYYHAQVVDKNNDTGNVMLGLSCQADRIKFHVTREFLNAYRSYEKVSGTEGIDTGQEVLVAQFPIVKHFDKKRAYNPATGIESNVIEENTEAPFEKRRYIQVDWTKNQVKDAECSDMIDSIAMVDVPRADTQDPKDPFKLRIAADYIETTNDVTIKKDADFCQETGDWNCSASSVRMKYSFRKILPGNDYVPLDYPDVEPLKVGRNANQQPCVEGDKGCSDFNTVRVHQGDLGEEPCDLSQHSVEDCMVKKIDVHSQFGFFRTQKSAYSREKGFVSGGKQQLINRWNLWEQSLSPNGAVIPLQQRVPKPIVYYMNPQYPVALRPAAQKVASEWNLAISHTVAQLKNMCTVRGANEYIQNNDLQAEMKNAKIPAVTEQNLSQACDKLAELSADKKLNKLFFSGHVKQINQLYGDLFQIRVNTCNVDNVRQYAVAHQLEQVLAQNQISLGALNEQNIEEACAVLEYATRTGVSDPFHWEQLGDSRYAIFNYIHKKEQMGLLGYAPAVIDPLTGEIIAATVNLYGESLEESAGMGADIVSALNNSADERNAVVNAVMRGYTPVSGQTTFHEIDQIVNERIERSKELTSLPGTPTHSVDSQMDLLSETGFEDEYLITEDMRHLFDPHGNHPNRAKPSSWARHHSLGDADDEDFHTFERKVHLYGQHNACFFTAMTEPAVAELALHLKGKTWEEAHAMILENMVISTALHEAGHALGLRHNFKGSSDALNYFSNAWGVHTDQHFTSRYTDRKSETLYSSTMDYAQGFNADFAGLGPYDFAAIARGYGEMVEVFDESQSEFVPRQWIGLLGLFHYKDLPYLFAGKDANETVIKHYLDVERRHKKDASAKIDVKSLKIKPNPENLYKRKMVPYAEYKRAVALRHLDRMPDNGKELFAVPYAFCTDGNVREGDIMCARWQAGASAEEIVDTAINNYEFYYPFSAFKRDRINFGINRYWGSLEARTFKPVKSALADMYVLRRSQAQIWPVAQDRATATYKGLNFLARVLQTVEPGRYCLDSNHVYVPAKEGESCEGEINIPLGQGRYFQSNWTNEYNAKIESIGNVYDKMAALRVLTDQVALSADRVKDLQDNNSDSEYSIGYYRLFAPELVKFFSALMRGDFSQYAPRVAVENKGVTLHYAPLVGSDVQTQVDMPKIMPTSSFKLKLYAMVFPMFRYTNKVDRQLDFAKRSRITIVGSPADMTTDTHVEQVVFTDPYSHVQYKAVAPEGEELSPAYQILKDAYGFVQPGTQSEPAGLWYQAKTQVTSLQLQMTAASAEERETIEQKLKQAKQTFRKRDRELREKVKFIELMKILSDNIG